VQNIREFKLLFKAATTLSVALISFEWRLITPDGMTLKSISQRAFPGSSALA